MIFSLKFYKIVLGNVNSYMFHVKFITGIIENSTQLKFAL